MLRRPYYLPLLSGLGTIMLVVGCSRMPARIKAPYLNIGATASKAMTQFDTNGDGRISGEELRANSAIATFDSNGDGAVDEDEIKEQLNQWQESRMGLVAMLITVTLKGKPLQGATITFQPEDFLAEAIAPAEGVTNQRGMAALAIPQEKLPNPKFAGVQLGMYKVTVSKKAAGRELVPTKYNSSSVMGYIVSPTSQKVLMLPL